LSLRRASVVAGLCLGLLAPRMPNPPAPVSLRQALDAAWALSPAARAATSRQAELQARAGAARAFLSGSPSATLAHRTDRLQTNAGLREYEAEVGLPLWNPGMRQATQRQVAADAALLDQQTCAGPAQAGRRAARSSRPAGRHCRPSALAARKLDEASRLASTPSAASRRAIRLAWTCCRPRAPPGRQKVAGPGRRRAARARGHWRSLTGLNATPAWSEQPGTPDHPGLLAAQAQVRSAQMRLALTDADRRDPMELGVGLTRERAAAGAPGETTMRFALRIPFGGDTRNAAKLAAARAELDAAQAEADALQRQIEAERESARSSWTPHAAMRC
jgi:cobalt-zinc-cadmium efflux system outer membrane protein